LYLRDAEDLSGWLTHIPDLLQEFPFLSAEAIDQTLAKLERRGFLIRERKTAAPLTRIIHDIILHPVFFLLKIGTQIIERAAKTKNIAKRVFIIGPPGEFVSNENGTITTPLVLPQSTVVTMCRSFYEAAFTAEFGLGSFSMCKIEHKCRRQMEKKALHQQ
jgi:hypothetical protein